jgi:hypothetical protein
MKCLHGSIHNQTNNTLRLSCDVSIDTHAIRPLLVMSRAFLTGCLWLQVRYQPAADVFDNRWMPSGDGARPSGHGGEEAPEKTMTLEEAKVSWGITPRQAAL